MNPLQEARTLHSQHELERAWALYEAAAPQHHASSDYWLWLALLAWQSQHAQSAQQCLQESQNRWRGHWPATWEPLSPVQAEALLDMLDALQPQPAFWQSLEQALMPSGLLNGAQRAHIWYRWLDTGFRQQPELESLLVQQPDWLEGQNLLASFYLFKGQVALARQTWEYLLNQHPEFLQARIQLGHCALVQGAYEEALAHYQLALAQQPQQPELHYRLGQLYLSLLNSERAQAHLQQARQQRPEHVLWQLQADWAHLPLPNPEPGADQALAQKLSAVAQRYAQQIPLELASEELKKNSFEPCFDINYLSESDHQVRSSFADIFILPKVPQWGTSLPEGMQLGVVITPGQESLFLFGSQLLLEELALAGVQITLFYLAASGPKLHPWAQKQRFHTVVLPPVLAQAAARIQQAQLDLVYLWESGTHAFNYLLPFYQLGRVQFTSWGSVSSTGNPRMQYFLSTPELDPPGNEACYREKLLHLPALPLIYLTRMLETSPRQRRGQDLPAEGLLLGCPHNPLKYSPAFLLALREILLATPTAQVVMVESLHPAWREALRNYIAGQLGPAQSQVIWLPRMSGPDLLALLKEVDLLLDPFPFGAGKLAFEALALGRPMLTCPGQRLRGRITAAAYRQLGHTQLICESPQDYVQKALALLRDPIALNAHSLTLIQLRQRLMQHPNTIPGLLAALGQMLKR